ncbi:MAG: nucleoside phosphorylase [Kosmotogaceae bacterium]
MEKDLPFFEHSYDELSIIEPSKIYAPVEKMPQRVVLVFYQKVVEKLLNENLLEDIHEIKSETGIFPIYRLLNQNEDIAIINPGLGAPLSGAVLEELIAFGVQKCIACGSAGVLKKECERGSLIVVSSAVRDEGTSYHYLPPSREVAVDQEIVKIIESTLGEIGVPCLTGKTWTTDAIYREPRGIIEKRLSENCLTVEMEASALIAISQFRKIEFGQLLSCGDDVSGDEWDRRFHPEAHINIEKLFWLDLICCSNL